MAGSWGIGRALALIGFVSMVGCGADAPARTDQPEQTKDAQEATQRTAHALLGALRARHPAPANANLPASLAVLSGGSKPLPVRAPLDAVSGVRIERREQTTDAQRRRVLRPVLAEPARARVSLELPERADLPFALRDNESGVEIRVRPLDARGAAAAVSDGMVIYPAAFAHGAPLIQRVTELGTEDFVAFDQAPPEPELGYELELGSLVGGLRLVENTLEVLDASGVPRLRVERPYLIDAEGQRRPAELRVDGCAVDRDPSAPFERRPVSPGAASCEVWVRWAASLRYPALLDPAWHSTGALAEARFNASSASLPNGRILVTGGDGLDGRLASTEIYDPVSRSWAVTGSLLTARAGATATRRATGQVLVAGGYDLELAGLASSELYDQATGLWLSGPPLRSARYDHSAVLLNNGDVLVAGGSERNAEKLSSRGSSFGPAGTTLDVANAATLVVLSDARALLTAPNTAPQYYQVSTNTWLPAPPSIAPAHDWLTATRLQNGQVLLVGTGVPRTEVFDPASGTWTRTGATSAIHYRHTATLLRDGRVLIVGGVNAWEPAHLESELYDPTSGTFSAGPTPATRRAYHVQSLLPSGRVLVAGGLSFETGELLASAEEFDPNALATTATEYKLPASIDGDVLSDRMTELWASVTRPVPLSAGRRYPLVVFLHGNHATCGIGTNPRSDNDCSYTDSGTCPPGYVVTPNHRGYDYITSALAGRGYVVVSINANRGINCAFGAEGDDGLNLARGRLILKHLSKLSEWNRGVSATPASVGLSLRGTLDFSELGLLGHSRGGEGARAAYEQYRDAGSPWPGRIVAPVNFRGIFEIGPVDGQTSRVLNAFGTRWNVLLPMCDGDVSTLEGVRPFDRNISRSSDASPEFHSTFTVWGANHNFYNTEWQESDSFGCTDHRPLFSSSLGPSAAAEQRQTGLRSVLEFFQGTVGASANPEHRELFDPQAWIDFDSPIERGYTPGQASNQVRELENFTRATGTNMTGVKNVHSRVSVRHGNIAGHDEALNAATLSWTVGGPATYFQTNFSAAGSGLDLRSYAFLDFRAGRLKDPLNTLPRTLVHVQLVRADGSVSAAVSSEGYAPPLIGPVAGPYGEYHQMLSTVRLPLSSFERADLTSVRGIRFGFLNNQSGKIYLANVRVSRDTARVSPARAARTAAAANRTGNVAGTAVITSGPALPPARRLSAGNSVNAIRTSSDGRSIELLLSKPTPFQVKDDLLTLGIGSELISVSRHPQGDLRAVVFSLPKAAFEQLPNGAPLQVQYRRAGGDVWDFGVLDKARLDQ